MSNGSGCSPGSEPRGTVQEPMGRRPTDAVPGDTGPAPRGDAVMASRLRHLHHDGNINVSATGSQARGQKRELCGPPHFLSSRVLRFRATSACVVFAESRHLTLTSSHGRPPPLRAHQLRGEMVEAARPPPRRAARLHPVSSGRIRPLGFSLKPPRGFALRDGEIEPRQLSCEHRKKGRNVSPGTYLFSWLCLQMLQNASVELQAGIRRAGGE